MDRDAQPGAAPGSRKPCCARLRGHTQRRIEAGGLDWVHQLAGKLGLPGDVSVREFLSAAEHTAIGVLHQPGHEFWSMNLQTFDGALDTHRREQDRLAQKLAAALATLATPRGQSETDQSRGGAPKIAADDRLRFAGAAWLEDNGVMLTLNAKPQRGEQARLQKHLLDTAASNRWDCSEATAKRMARNLIAAFIDHRRNGS
jgi:hypothetical protein